MRLPRTPCATVRTLALLAGWLALAAGCTRGEPEEEGKLPTTPVPVTAATVRRGALEPSIELVGTLVAIPEHTASVSAQTARWIEKVTVVEGSEVHAGDTLVQLDARMANADRDRAKGSADQKAAVLARLLRGSLPQEIEMARLEAEKAKFSAGALRAQLAALEVLLDKKEISAVQYENVRSSLRAAEATQAAAEARLHLVRQGSQPEEITQAQAQLAGAQAELAAAQLTVDFCNITSPIDGTVTRLSARVGALADPAAPLATVADLSRLFARVVVPSAYQAKVRVGAAVDVLVAGEPERPVPGSIARISSEAAPTTGDVDAFTLVENKERALRPGFACTVRVRLAPVEDALVIPSATVADREGKPVVTVVRDGKAYEIEVRLGVQTRHEVQVLEGLSEGDVVVTEGGYGLPDGCPVEVRPLRE